VAGTTAPDDFQTNVMTPLVAYAQALDALDLSFAAVRLPEARWSRELPDGFAIDRTRAHFVFNAYAAVLAHIAGDDVSAQAARDRAARSLDEAAAIVAGRHADRHDADPMLVTRNGNSTTYGFGYL